MTIVALDLEGVLVPEIWISFAEKTGLDELKRTTRDEPDYRKLMKYRIDILKREGLKLKDIQDVISTMDPLDGAKEFLDKLREETQVVILSDTFVEFAKPLMKKLSWPTIFSNSLVVSDDGEILDIRMRQEEGKMNAIKAFSSMGFKTFAAGDSYNDLKMIRLADNGCLFRAPKNILQENGDLKIFEEYDDFFSYIKGCLV